MSKSIERLSQSVIDSIAAGEVLERPANLVKELVENSLDAGATEVEVDADQGGRRIKVSDNGHGIAGDELPMALERHATSKIRAFDDLFALSSFGFRGEALASVAAVSRLAITSRARGGETANRIVSEFGSIAPVDAVAGAAGTLVQVEDLFQNVPARLKFLKSDSSESAQIKKVMKAMALARPDVTFRLKSRGELISYWPATDSRVKRAEQVLEHKPLYEASGQSGDMTVHISFSAPDKGQRTGQNIWVFAQDRWIQDKTIFAAVMDAYRSLLMHGEFPSAVVSILCPPENIDVNVHPTKAQVKFRDGSEVYRLVQGTLRRALERAPWAPHVADEPGAAGESVPKPVQETFARELQTGFSETNFKRKFEASSKPAGVRAPEPPPLKLSELAAAAESREAVHSAPIKKDETPGTEARAFEIKPYWANLQILGQANLTYIVAQSRQSMIVVDQHAAHERVAFERLMSGWRDGNLEVQPYLLPLTLHLQPEEVEALVSQQDALERLHISIDQSGPEAISVRAAPALLKESAIRSALQKLAQEILTHQGSFAFEKVVGDICATMACHSVVRAGQALSADEMKALLAQMDEFPLSGYCPHGRPVYVEYSFAQMDRQFGRTL
ncbi:MAG TPA: DNA mismatch repair endonuclease MutL [Bdellovibrionales bacterium]|nr:DNA mismatch repair endonuclease MutL [Bdellovibrionales bacterium]